MADAEFREGDIDIQFLERRPELAAPSAAPEQAIALAVAAALAEDDARARRRPSVSDAEAVESQWLGRARLEALE